MFVLYMYLCISVDTATRGPENVTTKVIVIHGVRVRCEEDTWMYVRFVVNTTCTKLTLIWMLYLYIHTYISFRSIQICP